MDLSQEGSNTEPLLGATRRDDVTGSACVANEPEGRDSADADLLHRGHSNQLHEPGIPQEQMAMLSPKQPNTLCGLGGWRPAWLQRLATNKAFMVLFGFIGMCEGAMSAYNVSTISTLEKRFQIPSRTTGLVVSAWDVASIVSLVLLSYSSSRGHQPLWMSFGVMLLGLSAFVKALPHFIFGAGQLAIDLAYEAALNASTSGNATSHSAALCGSPWAEQEDCSEEHWAFSIPAAILFVSQLIMGFGGSIYFILGVAYLDDNTSKNKAPVLIATPQIMRMVGPTIGFSVGTYALSRYVDPALQPAIDSSDPRWIGAWWMGWPPLGAVMCLLAAALLLFPRELRRPLHKLRERAVAGRSHASFKDFVSTWKRLLKNKVLLFNTLSTVSFLFGMTGHWVFMPKYMETQFGQTAAMASFYSGWLGLLFPALGLGVASVIITRFKPRPRTLAAWCVFVECIDVLGHTCWAFIGCPNDNLHGSWTPEEQWNLTAGCNAGCDCGPSLKYAPVCAEGGATFYSPCHAGCLLSHADGNATAFLECGCIAGGRAVQGACPKDCGWAFAIFLTTQSIMRFLGATGRAGNTLLQIRCVLEEDKALSIAFTEILVSALAFLPAPNLYGILLDKACLVWGRACGRRGNCWLYDGVSMRHLLNFTAAGFFALGTLLDVGVWYHCGELKIYEEDEKVNGQNSSDQPLQLMKITAPKERDET